MASRRERMYIFNCNSEYQEKTQHCSVAELEDMAVKEYTDNLYGEDSRLGDILNVRKRKLNGAFKWTEKNIARLHEIDEAIISAFAKAEDEIKLTIGQFKQRINNDDKFINAYDFSVKVSVYAELGRNDFCMILHDIAHNKFHRLIEMVPLEMSGNTFKVYLTKKYSIMSLDEDNVPELQGHKFAAGLQELCDYSVFSLPDILKINKLETSVITEHQHFVGKV
jgi:hypothetical protein